MKYVVVRTGEEAESSLVDGYSQVAETVARLFREVDERRAREYRAKGDTITAAELNSERMDRVRKVCLRAEEGVETARGLLYGWPVVYTDISQARHGEHQGWTVSVIAVVKGTGDSENRVSGKTNQSQVVFRLPAQAEPRRLAARIAQALRINSEETERATRKNIR